MHNVSDFTSVCFHITFMKDKTDFVPLMRKNCMVPLSFSFET